jgi:hypothetical protein
LLALACAVSFAACGGSDETGPADTTTAASAADEGPDAAGQGVAPNISKGKGQVPLGEADDSQANPPPPRPASPSVPGATTPDRQPLAQALQHPKNPHSPHGDGGGPEAGLSPQEAAAYETARALCANPDSLQYAPEEIRDDAEAMARFAERFAPPGEEQTVHDGCLEGLKSIGID